MSKKRPPDFSQLIIIVAAIILVACGDEGTNENQQEATRTSTEVIELDLSPTIVEIAPTEEPKEENEQKVEQEEKIETSVDEVSNPNIIDGIDFTSFNLGSELIFEPMGKIEYDSLRWIVIANHKVETILSDGNLFKQHEELGRYTFYLYSPKKVVSVTPGNDITIVNKLDGGTFGNVHYDGLFMAEVEPNLVGKNLEIGVIVTYEDGMEDTLTIYVTKEYKVTE